jgi:RNA recognition motif-containing protein
MNKEPGTSTMKPSNIPSTPPIPGLKSTTPTNSPHMTPMKSSPPGGSSFFPMDSRGAVDPRINMDEFAYNKIFVGGLHYDTKDRKFPFILSLFSHFLPLFDVFLADFRGYFEKYGKILSAEVMFNRETHKSRGFGFIVFEEEQGAIAACADHEHIIDGKVVSCLLMLQSFDYVFVVSFVSFRRLK